MERRGLQICEGEERDMGLEGAEGLPPSRVIHPVCSLQDSLAGVATITDQGSIPDQRVKGVMAANHISHAL